MDRSCQVPASIDAALAGLLLASFRKRNTLNGLLARLVKDGELQKRSLPTRRTGYGLSAGAAPTGGEGADKIDAPPADSAAE